MPTEYLSNFIEKMHFGDDLCEKICSTLRGGKNVVYHNAVSEAITLDENWVSVLENALFSVEKIVKSPRRFIKEEDILVDVERARRTTAKTVRHLSSHSQFVSNIDEDGNVTPKKVLTTEMDEDLAIYENRFICSLVQRLFSFVEKRYNELLGKLNAYDQTAVGILSSFNYGTSEVECKLDIKVREQSHNKVLLEKNSQLVERISRLRQRIRVLLGTSFIQFLSTKKAVHPPILKTNLIKMNVDYQSCYKLWLYVASYTVVGFSVQYQDKNLPVDGDYYDDLTVIAALSVQSLFSNHLLKKEEYEALPYKKINEKQFRLVTSYKFTPDSMSLKREVGEESVNEYYFKHMRDELVRATKRGEIKEEKEFKLSFARFYRSIAKINERMYEDVMDAQTSVQKNIRQKTPLQKKEWAVKEQQIKLRRYKQLSLLKKEELEKALKLESRELIKLEKLQGELDKERGKQKDKKLKQKQRKERLEKIKAKGAKAQAKAMEYEKDLREKDAAKLAAAEESKRLKREQARRRRELKRLEELKEKYDGQG